jgi:redox-sensing transcriptional repressor
VILDTQSGQKVAVVGLGNLGRAFIRYFAGKRTKLSIVAAFDVNPEKIDSVYNGVTCYGLDRITEVIVREKISIAIITVPVEESTQIADLLIRSGIKGILNYTSKALNVPSDVFLEEYDMVTSLEKVAYFAKGN